MKILNDYLQQLKDSFGRFCLSMSGEITIADKEAKDLLHLNDEDKQKIASIMHELRSEFPFVLIEKQENMVECHIKLFAYKQYHDIDGFLEKLRIKLVSCLQAFHGNECLSARVAISGEVMDSHEACKFVFLSRNDSVEYKITDKKELSGCNEVVYHKLKVIFFIVLFSALIIMALYELYALIPDHDPQKLLKPVIEI